MKGGEKEMGKDSAGFARYRNDPVGYAREVLGVRWWDKQVEVARALMQHKRVFVKASHSVGKSFLAGGLVNWFFDCFDLGLCITTAPTARQVQDILWKEIRSQRPALQRGVLLPRACRMETGPEHFAIGYTAREGSGFQGCHAEHVLIVFDEATGVDSAFWDAAEGMMTGVECYWLVILNPTDAASRAYEECQNTQKWHVMEISALEHPNITADLKASLRRFPALFGWNGCRGGSWNGVRLCPRKTGRRRISSFRVGAESGIVPARCLKAGYWDCGRRRGV